MSRGAAVPEGYRADQVRFVPPDGSEAGWILCRRVRRDDAGALYEAISVSLDHLRPWMPWADGYTRESERQFIDRNTSDEPGGAVSDSPYVVADRAGRVLGLCGLHARLEPGRLEIGYWVDVRHTRRGVATLSAAMLAELAFGMAEIEAVEIHHDEANRLSGRVPARLGFEHTATVSSARQAPGESGVEWQWRISRELWPGSPGARLLAQVRATHSASTGSAGPADGPSL